jgi:hypothetical protein
MLHLKARMTITTLSNDKQGVTQIFHPSLSSVLEESRRQG